MLYIKVLLGWLDSSKSDDGCCKKHIGKQAEKKLQKGELAVWGLEVRGQIWIDEKGSISPIL